MKISKLYDTKSICRNQFYLYISKLWKYFFNSSKNHTILRNRFNERHRNLYTESNKKTNDRNKKIKLREK